MGGGANNAIDTYFRRCANRAAYRIRSFVRKVLNDQIQKMLQINRLI